MKLVRWTAALNTALAAPALVILVFCVPFALLGGVMTMEGFGVGAVILATGCALASAAAAAASMAGLRLLGASRHWERVRRAPDLHEALLGAVHRQTTALRWVVLAGLLGWGAWGLLRIGHL